MTAETRAVIDKWITDNAMGPPIHGAVYDPGNEALTDVGIDGGVDLAELAESIESAECERCAAMADRHIPIELAGGHFCSGAGCLCHALAKRICGKDHGCDPPQAKSLPPKYRCENCGWLWSDNDPDPICLCGEPRA